MTGVRPRSPIGGGKMHRAVSALGIAVALAATPALAQEDTLLEKFKDWTAYAGTGTPKVCFAVAKPTESNPKKIKRGPILFYISQWPADKVTNEVSVKMGYPFGDGAKTTVTVGTEKFELFTKDEGAFVEKPETETKLLDAMKTGNTMKIEGKSSRGTATTDTYSLNGLADAIDRAAKECSG